MNKFLIWVGAMLPMSVSLAESPPQPFEFGNHMDTHQRTWLVTDDAIPPNPAQLVGYLYIVPTGEFLNGEPVYRHPRGPGQHEEECDTQVECFVGWNVRGLPGQAKFISHSGNNGHDHPLWEVNRDAIPQPGHYTHFHWIGADGDDPRAGSVPAECDKDTASELEGNVIIADKRLLAKQVADVDQDGTKKYVWNSPAEEVHVGAGADRNARGGEVLPTGAEDVICPGWFMELTATREFLFQHGGEVVRVKVGSDNATHLNLLTNYAIVPRITPTR